MDDFTPERREEIVQQILTTLHNIWNSNKDIGFREWTDIFTLVFLKFFNENEEGTIVNWWRR